MADYNDLNSPSPDGDGDGDGSDDPSKKTKKEWIKERGVELKEKGKELKNKALRSLDEQKEKAGAVYKDKKGKAGLIYDEKKEQAGAVYKDKKNKAGLIYDEKKRLAGEYVEAKIEKIKAEALEMSEPALDYVILQCGELAGEAAVDDKDMPHAVRRNIRSIIDGIWPDVMEEAKVSLHSLIRKKAPAEKSDHPSCCCWPRAKVLHALYPNNKSFWGRINGLLYWILYLISITPVFGVSTAFFLFVFILVDKSDEYQLIRFIQTFKGSLFLSGGVFQCFIGAGQYVTCVNMHGSNKGAQDEHNCQTNGPGANELYFLDTAALLIQIILVWSAFLFLPYSAKKGNLEYKHRTIHEKRINHWEAENIMVRRCCFRTFCCICIRCCCREKNNSLDRESLREVGKTKAKMRYENHVLRYTAGRNRLRYLLMYDLVICLALLGGLIYISYDMGAFDGSNPMDLWNDWLFKSYVFWFRCLYGLTSFPFLIINLPVLHGLFTHARTTGYDNNGHCVPMAIPTRPLEEVKADRKKRALKRKKTLEDAKIAAAWSVEEAERASRMDNNPLVCVTEN